MSDVNTTTITRIDIYSYVFFKLQQDSKVSKSCPILKNIKEYCPIKRTARDIIETQGTKKNSTRVVDLKRVKEYSVVK